MRAIGKHLPALDLDVLALQEVWTAEARELLVQAGREAGLTHTWHPSGAFRDGGLLVLSRIPLHRARFERYALPGLPPRADHLDYYVSKGFLDLRFETEAGAFHLFDTHLHARYGSDVPHEYHAYRVGQIVQLALALEQAREPVVVAGDFNLRDDTSEYRILAGLTGLRDLAVEHGNMQPTVYDAHPYRRTQRDRRIDYLFARDGGSGGLAARNVHRAFDDVFEIDGVPASFSDHAGLLAELELGTSPVQARRAPDAEVVALASRALRQGRDDTRRRRREDRLVAGAGLGAAVAAGAGMRAPRVTRRRLLRGVLQGAAVAALAPGLGFSVLSEVYAPGELDAFEQLASHLDTWPTGDGWIA